nr:glycosyltransferase family 4 protein [Paraburkholderia fynbosensis]
MSGNLVRSARCFNPTVIHLASAGLAVYAAQLEPIAPLICTVHCKDLTQPWQSTPGRIPQAEIRRGLLRCRTVICVSRYTQRFLHSLVPEIQSTVITHGIDIPGRPLGCRPAPPRPRLISVSRLVPRKGHALLAKALANVHMPFFWDIVGDGPERGNVESCLSRWSLGGKASMHGRVRDDRLRQLLSTATLFALTPVEIHSVSGIDAEGFGLVYLEAAVHGLPAIASAASAAEEIIVPGHTGILVDPENTDMFAAAIIDLFAHPDRCREMGEAAREHVQRQFGMDRHIDALIRVYAAAYGASP